MTGRRIAALLGAVTLGLLGPLLLATPGTTAVEDPCADVVAPGAPEVADDAAVAQALETLRADGVVPWVRVWQNVPAGDLDEAVRSAAADCPGVRGKPSGLARTVVVLAVSLDDRASGLYFGRAWDATLGGQWESALSAEVNPLLAGGDVPSAVAAGLVAVDGLVTGTTGGTAGDTSSGGSSDVTDGTAPEADPVVEGDPFVAGDPFVEQAPDLCTDLPEGVDASALGCARGGSGGTVVAVVLVGTALAGASFGAAGLRTRSRLRGLAAEAATAATTQETALAASLDGVTATATGLAAGLDAADADDVRGRAAAAQARVDEVRKAVALEDRAHPRDRVGAMSSDQARAAAAAWTRTADRIGDARLAVAEVRSGLDADAESVAALAGDLAAVDAELAGARNRVATVTEGGFTVAPCVAALDEAAGGVATARAASASGRRLTAARSLTAARATAAEAVARAEGLPARRDAVLAAASAVAERTDDLRAAVAQAAERFARLRDAHDGSCWTDLAAGVEDAPARIERAVAAVEDAQVAVSMRAQRWHDAEAAADRARQDADAVTAHTDAVGSRLAAVEEAQRLLPDRGRRALDAAQDVARYVRRHDRDVPVGLSGEAARAEAALEAVVAGLAAPKPAWLRLRDETAAAESAVEEVRRTAEAAVRRAEQERADERARRRRRAGAAGAAGAGLFAGSAAGAGSAFGDSGGSSFGSSGSDSMGGGSTSW